MGVVLSRSQPPQASHTLRRMLPPWRMFSLLLRDVPGAVLRLGVAAVEAGSASFSEARRRHSRLSASRTPVFAFDRVLFQQVCRRILEPADVAGATDHLQPDFSSRPASPGP